LGVRRMVLVGHSYGGLLSLYHAAHQPDRVAGLVLVDPMNPIFVDKVTLAWLKTTVPDIPDPKTPKEVTITRMKRDMAEFVAATRPAGAAIRVPVVVITAGRPWFGKPPIDSAWRQSHEELVAAGKRRELVVATKSEHGIPATEPELIVGAVARILALAEPGRKY
ncbi:MAG: alpha/beta hydrolase, partial [Gemmatimonadota bacterium]